MRVTGRPLDTTERFREKPIGSHINASSVGKMPACSSGSCLTLSSRSLAFSAAVTAEGGGAAIKAAVEISKTETVEMPPLAPEAQWLCDPADVPFPCWRAVSRSWPFYS